MASTLKVNIVGDAKKFTEATKKAESGLGKMGKATNKVASMMKGALGAIAGAISVDAIVGVLKDATTAAMEDAKSQALLAKQMQNTVGANKEMTKSAEDAISKMSLMAAVPDDEIRPAFASFIRSTKSVKKATDLTALALDVSAGTGKDLTTVTKALTAAYGGNTKSLSKMGINVKKGGNWVKELKKQFKGMAEEQARQDPAKRIQVAFGELQESLGKGLLPILNQVADMFVDAAPKVQAFFDAFWKSSEWKSIQDLGKAVWEDVLKPMIEGLSSPDAQQAFNDFANAFRHLVDAMTDFAKSNVGKALAWLVDNVFIQGLKMVADNMERIASAIKVISGTGTVGDFKKAVSAVPGTQWLMSQAPGKTIPNTVKLSDVFGGTYKPNTYGPSTTGNTTININVTKTDPKAVVDEINKWAKKNGNGRLSFSY